MSTKLMFNASSKEVQRIDSDYGRIYIVDGIEQKIPSVTTIISHGEDGFETYRRKVAAKAIHKSLPKYTTSQDKVFQMGERAILTERQRHLDVGTAIHHYVETGEVTPFPDEEMNKWLANCIESWHQFVDQYSVDLTAMAHEITVVGETVHGLYAGTFDMTMENGDVIVEIKSSARASSTHAIQLIAYYKALPVTPRIAWCLYLGKYYPTFVPKQVDPNEIEDVFELFSNYHGIYNRKDKDYFIGGM